MSEAFAMTPERYVERTGPRDIECRLISVEHTGSGAFGAGAWVVRFEMEREPGVLTAVYFPRYDDDGEPIDPVEDEDFQLAILRDNGAGFFRSDYFHEWIVLVVEHHKNGGRR